MSRAGGSDGDVVVRADSVGRVYRLEGALIEAVRDVSLAVRPSEFLAITGPSGSGKSTLLHLLGAVDTPTSGRVLLEGADPASLPERLRARLRLLHVGFIFQRFHLLPMLNARENVELPMAEAGVPRREREERAGALLARVGLSDRLRHRPAELSGGQRQRVAIARALANRPWLILADEPTGELDRATSRGILELFQELAEGGQTLVVATHDLELAAGAGRRLALRDGALVRP